MGKKYDLVIHADVFVHLLIYMFPRHAYAKTMIRKDKGLLSEN